MVQTDAVFRKVGNLMTGMEVVADLVADLTKGSSH
jgi:hypothetical protein